MLLCYEVNGFVDKGRAHWRQVDLHSEIEKSRRVDVKSADHKIENKGIGNARDRKVKIVYAYKVDHDLGMNPNPFGAYCTLAYCNRTVNNYPVFRWDMHSG